MNRTSASKWSPVAVLAALAVLASAPGWLQPYYLSIATLTIIYIGLASAWNIVGGIAGQFSLGHSMFVALGATLVATLVADGGLNPWVAMLLGAAAAGVLALLISMLAFRFKLSHLSFALITLALAEVGLLLVLSTDALGGASGVVWPRGNGVAQMGFEPAGYFWFAGGAASLTCLVAWWVLRSKTGYYLRAIRDDEQAASALGVNLFWYKTFAMVLSAMLTAVVATVLARYQTFVDPNHLASPILSISVILYAVVGGLGTVRGPIIGAGILYPAGEILRGEFGGVPGLHEMIFGLAIILIVLYAPRGLAGIPLRLPHRRRASPDPASTHGRESVSNVERV